MSNLNTNRFFALTNKAEDKVWNCIRCEAKKIIELTGANNIVEYAKERADWNDFLALEELAGIEPDEDIANLFVQDMIYAEFLNSSLTGD